ncbi:MAG: putative dehydrogenase, partial [Limisphaerales bacterium]
MSDKKFNVAVVGLGFGAEFIPIHQAHPNGNVIAVCRRNEAELNKVADALDVPKRYTDYDELLKDPEIDAVHINSPISDHASQSLKALRAG